MKNLIRQAQEKINKEKKVHNVIRYLEKQAEQLTITEYRKTQENDFYKELNFN